VREIACSYYRGGHLVEETFMVQPCLDKVPSRYTSTSHAAIFLLSRPRGREGLWGRSSISIIINNLITGHIPKRKASLNYRIPQDHCVPNQSVPQLLTLREMSIRSDTMAQLRVLPFMQEIEHQIHFGHYDPVHTSGESGVVFQAGAEALYVIRKSRDIG
jgi:hypothetical protein